MYIANPLYDVVFRYLLEDIPVAKLFLSTLLEKEIVDLKLLPTEVAVNLTKDQKEALQKKKQEKKIEKLGLNSNRTLTVLRLDFAATIKDKEGKTSQIIIELQKARLLNTMERFRKYLGKQYLNSNLYYKIPSPPPATRAGVPIYPIYILGYKLGGEYEKIPVLVVENNVFDRFSRKEVQKNNPFITSLFHEGMIIQIPELKKQRRDRVERLLSIYDSAELNEKFILEVTDDYPPEFRTVIARLVAAAADEDIRDTMEAEDELLREIELWEEEIENKKKEVRAAKKELRKAQKQLDGTKAQLDGTKAQLAEERVKAKEAEKQAEEAKKQALDAEKSVKLTLKNSALALRNASFSDEKIADFLHISLRELSELMKD